MHSSIARFMTFLAICGTIGLVYLGVVLTGGEVEDGPRRVGAVVNEAP